MTKSSSDRLAGLKDIRCFLLDMDGTFYLGERLLEGSLDFIRALDKKGIDYLFLTNNSSRSGSHYIEKLRRMGLETDQVLTSGQATAMYLKEAFAQTPIFLLGNESLKDEMIKSGLNIVDQGAKAVCIGYDTTFTYKKMCILCDYVRAGLPYIATHPDFNCPVDSESGFEPDIGAVIAFVEASTGRRPDAVIGKPNRHIVEAALARTGSKVEETCMVGDRLYTDIATGLNFGMLSLLVMTGEAKEEDLKTTPFVPDIVLPRLSDIIKYI
ncbi:MAG: HAD-IIA family hydrolase [Christensenellales bacterium]